MALASRVLNCQLMVALAALRSLTRAYASIITDGAGQPNGVADLRVFDCLFDFGV